MIVAIMCVIVRFGNVGLVGVDFHLLHTLSIVKYAFLYFTTVIFVNFCLAVEFSFVEEADEAVTYVQVGGGELARVAMQFSSLELAFLYSQNLAKVRRKIFPMHHVLNDAAVAVHCTFNVAH